MACGLVPDQNSSLTGRYTSNVVAETIDPHKVFAPESEDDMDFAVTTQPTRQYTDSVLQMTSTRRELESTIANLLRSHLPPSPPYGYVTEEPEPAPPPELPTPEGRNVQAPGLQAASLNNPTTLMIRHVPPKLSQRQLMREVNDFGFAGRFDFLYIPMDSRRRANRGIAFVNFASASVAQDFATKCNGRTLKHPSSLREVEVMPADLQGFEANVTHHIETLRSASDLNKPLILRRLPPHLLQAQAQQEVKFAKAPAAPKGRAVYPVPKAAAVSRQAAPQRGGGFSREEVAAARAEPQQNAPGLSINYCATCGLRKGQGFIFCPCCGERFIELL